MSEVIMIASGKGGVGKTTVTALLGSQLARMDKTVVMLDTDFGLRNLDLYFQLQERIVYNLVDVLCGTCSFQQAIIPIDEQRHLYLIPGSKDYHFRLTSEAFRILTQQLSRQFDVVLIDTPAGITHTHTAILPVITQALVVTTMTEAALSDGLAMCRFLHTRNLTARCIFNQLERPIFPSHQRERLQEISQELLMAEYLGGIPMIKGHRSYDLFVLRGSLQQICTRLSLCDSYLCTE